MKTRTVICCLLFSLNMAAQEPTDSVSLQPVKHTLLERLHQFQQNLDSAAVRKVDQRYIEVPDKPWRVVLRYKASEFDVDYDNIISDPNSDDRVEWRLSFKPPMTSSVGFWVGYRGTGLSVAKSLGKKVGTSLSFSTTGAKYGFNLRLKSFEIDDATLDATIYDNGIADHQQYVGHTREPVTIGSLYLNGYYVFNGRRYSQAAAYNQSVIQRHSAGSLLVGATCYLSALDLSDAKNAPIMFLSYNTGQIKLHQANLGIGYGYNLVPLRGLVINAMAMPTVSIYNRVKVYKYDFNYDLSSGELTDDYGRWNSQTHTWDNGKTYKPFLTAQNEGEKWVQDIDNWETEVESEYSSMRFNLDLRLGIAYNWRNFFVGLQGQFNGFTYKKGGSKVTLFDGYAQASLGVRL